MLPRLYDAKRTIEYYEYNGYGFFTDCNKCEVTEERNGIYTLTMTIAPTDKLAKTVTIGMIVKAKSNPYDNPQLFEINKVIIDKNGNIEVNAQHIKFLACQNCTLGNIGAANGSLNGTPNEIMEEILDSLTFDNLFSFNSNITTKKNFSCGINTVEKLGDILGGKDGSLIDVFGGEYHYDNFNIELLSSRGKITNSKIMMGQNISDYKQTITNDNRYTHILPYATVKNAHTGGEITLSGRPIEIKKMAFQRVLSVDFSSETNEISVDPTSGLNYTKLYDKLSILANDYLIKNGSKLTEEVNITVTYQPEIDKLQSIKLCDTVKVVFGINQSTTAKVTKTVYDSIRERYTTIEIGDSKVTLSNFINTKRRF